MKLHKNLALGVVEGLELILLKEELAQYIVPKILKNNSRWGSRDRRLVGRIIYDIIRWKRLYTATIKKNITGKSDLWELLACWLILNDAPLPKWDIFAGIEVTAIRKNYTIACQTRAIKQAIPDWLDQMGVEAYGEDVWENELTSLNQPAQLIIRVNTLKIHQNELEKILLDKEKIKAAKHLNYPDALILEKQFNLKQNSYYRKGLFEIQDANSQLIAPSVKPKPGMTIIDACAGAGGKTLHLAALMKNKGKLFAVDIHEHKLMELEKRAVRNGVQIIETQSAENAAFFNEWKAKADAVLIDAPCSGIGVLKKNPDAKWKMTPKKIDALIQLQKQLLQKNAPLVKPNGLLTYATCSILPKENENQVKIFLKSGIGEEFELLTSKTLFSHQTGFDGFYFATLKRKNVNK